MHLPENSGSPQSVSLGFPEAEKKMAVGPEAPGSSPPRPVIVCFALLCKNDDAEVTG